MVALEHCRMELKGLPLRGFEYPLFPHTMHLVFDSSALRLVLALAKNSSNALRASEV